MSKEAKKKVKKALKGAAAAGVVLGGAAAMQDVNAVYAYAAELEEEEAVAAAQQEAVAENDAGQEVGTSDSWVEVISVSNENEVADSAKAEEVSEVASENTAVASESLSTANADSDSVSAADSGSLSEANSQSEDNSESAEVSLSEAVSMSESHSTGVSESQSRVNSLSAVNSTALSESESAYDSAHSVEVQSLYQEILDERADGDQDYETEAKLIIKYNHAASNQVINEISKGTDAQTGIEYFVVNYTDKNGVRLTKYYGYSVENDEVTVNELDVSYTAKNKVETVVTQEGKGTNKDPYKKSEKTTTTENPTDAPSVSYKLATNPDGTTTTTIKINGVAYVNPSREINPDNTISYTVPVDNSYDYKLTLGENGEVITFSKMPKYGSAEDKYLTNDAEYAKNYNPSKKVENSQNTNEIARIISGSDPGFGVHYRYVVMADADGNLHKFYYDNNGTKEQLVVQWDNGLVSESSAYKYQTNGDGARKDPFNGDDTRDWISTTSRIEKDENGQYWLVRGYIEKNRWGVEVSRGDYIPDERIPLSINEEVDYWLTGKTTDWNYIRVLSKGEDLKDIDDQSTSQSRIESASESAKESLSDAKDTSEANSASDSESQDDVIKTSEDNAESASDSYSKVVSESIINSESGSSKQSDVNSNSGSDSVDNSESASNALSESESTENYESESYSKALSQSEKNANSESESTAKSDSESTANSESESTAKSDSESTANSESESTANSESESTANSDSESTAKSDSESTAKSESEIPDEPVGPIIPGGGNDDGDNTRVVADEKDATITQIIEDDEVPLANMADVAATARNVWWSGMPVVGAIMSAIDKKKRDKEELGNNPEDEDNIS